MNKKRVFKGSYKSKTIKDTYDKNAQWFSRNRDKSLFEKKWLDKFICKLPTKAKVIDVGCGSGTPIAGYLIEKGLDLVGVDFSQNLIDIAKTNYKNNDWLVADMRSLNLGVDFDGVIAWNSFFHLNHAGQLKALDCFSRHLKKDGILMFTAGPNNSEVLGKINKDDVYHCSYSFREYSEELSKRKCKIIDFKLDDLECKSHSVYLAQKLS